MSLKFFLKQYVRLVALTGLVLALCAGLFAGVSSVRGHYWQEHFPAPLMRWLAAVPQPAEQYHWLASLYDFRVADRAELALSPVIAERLSYGQVVAQATGLGQRILVRNDVGEILEIHFRDTYRDVAEALALISAWHLNDVLPGQRDDAMAEMSEHFGVGLRRLEDPARLPSAEVLQRVMDRGIAFHRAGPGGPGGALIRLQDGTLVSLDLPPPFNRWSWPVLLMLVLVAGGILAAALFLLLRDVDQNLRAVESVAMRIARGEMGARVEAGEGALVARLADAFNGMAEHIQRLVGVQRELIHAVSHELRTPVARIRFGVQMLESCKDQASLQKQLDGIDGDIQELDELIDEILTYARLEQGGPVFNLQEASVTDIVRQVVSEQQLIRPEVSIEAEIAADSEPWALSDIEPRYIHRAIQNLVGNAARYANSNVRVYCHIDEDTCRVDVEDDGPGVPEQDWEKVFTAFARLDDSRTRTSGGYGLGLSIVRRILFWHRGQAFVSRSPRLGGARFSLVWPRKKLDDSIM